MQRTEEKHIRPDHKAIAEIVKNGASVLDLGCGNGDLLYLLTSTKDIRGQGIEIDDKAIFECVEKGLSVFHGDIDSGLADYRDKSFDYVILNQSLQQVAHIDNVITDSLRVGKKVIVGVPNFAYYRSRMQVLLSGKMPVTSSLPYSWYDTPNVRFLTIRDFADYCRDRKINIEKKVFVGESKRVFIFPNMFASVGIFVLSR
jgi:methionine biosynthesis protein MetW